MLQQTTWTVAFILAATASAFMGGCSSDTKSTPNPTTNDSGVIATGDAASTTQNICLTVGSGDAVAGAKGIEGVVEQFVGKLVTDCRVSKFFTTLPDGGKHVTACLKIQVKELFGCPGVKYEGLKDDSGVVCRDMVVAHKGMGVTEKDYDALIEDLVSVIPTAVKGHPDFAAIAGALTAPKTEKDSLKSIIVEDKTATENKQPVCATDAGAGG